MYIMYMEFHCLCCNTTFKSNSNLLKHYRTAKHLKLKAKLEAEPSENIQFRNTISEMDEKYSIAMKRIAELEIQLKIKDDIINNIVLVVNKIAKSEKPEVKPEVKPDEPIEIPMKAKDMEAEAEAEADKYWEKYYKNRKIEILSGKEKEKDINEKPNLKQVDAIFLMENEVEYSDLNDIDDIRNYLGDLKWKKDGTKDVDELVSDIMEEAEMHFEVDKHDSATLAKWKNKFREESLKYIKDFVNDRNDIKEAKEDKGRKEWEKWRESKVIS